MECRRCTVVMVFVALLVAVLGFFASGEAATLTWKDNATNELGTEIERKPGLCAAGGAWAKIGEVGANIVTYLDATTIIGNAYCFRVRAFNNSLLDGSGVRQLSGYSNQAEISYPLAVPLAPSEAVATP